MKSIAHLEDDITSIRNLMERSTRFISLSGLSGILAGLYALIGAGVAYYLIYYPNSPFGFRFIYVNELDTLMMLGVTAASVASAALITGVILSIRKAKKNGLDYWNNNSKRFILNVCIPIFTGGIFIVSLMLRGHLGFVAPACLVFYGLGLVNASAYTYSDVRYLGLLEIALGLICSLVPGYGLIFWSLGFGVLHILYGTRMHFRYDRSAN